MFTVTKRMEISAGHQLDLPYDSPCRRLHGHNWIVIVTVQGLKLNEQGMLIDFGRLKQIVHGQLDHRNITGIIPGNPTAENVAYWIAEQIDTELGGKQYWTDTRVVRVQVQESEGNEAIWER